MSGLCSGFHLLSTSKILYHLIYSHCSVSSQISICLPCSHSKARTPSRVQIRRRKPFGILLIFYTLHLILTPHRTFTVNMTRTSAHENGRRDFTGLNLSNHNRIASNFARTAASQYIFSYLNTELTMAIRGGDARAMHARQRSPQIMPGSPDLTDNDTITNESTTDYDADDDEALKDKMRLTFAETRILELRRELIAAHERADTERKRAAEAEQALALADPDELRASNQHMLQAVEEKDAALAMRDAAKIEAERAKMETNRILEALLKTRKENKKLTADLDAASTASSSQYWAALDQLRTNIANRDAKIEQLVDKNDRLTAEQFAALETKKSMDTDTNFYKSLAENQKYDLKELQTKLAISQREIVRCVHSAFVTSVKIWLFYVNRLLCPDSRLTISACRTNTITATPVRAPTTLKTPSSRPRTPSLRTRLRLLNPRLAPSDLAWHTTLPRLMLRSMAGASLAAPTSTSATFPMATTVLAKCPV
jgi:hypothetical protein